MPQTKVQLVGSVVTGANFSGVLTSTSYESDTLSVGIAATISSVSISSGIVSATSLYGDGSQLTGVGAGASVVNDTTTDATFYPIFTDTTSGILTTPSISTTKLNFNPSSSKLSVGTGITFESGNISISSTITAGSISIPLGLG